MNNRIKSMLRSYKEGRRISKESGFPYCFEISQKDRFLYYFGGNHSKNPSDTQFKILTSYWKEFLTKVDKKNAIVLIEGRIRELHKTEEEAIRRDSEGGIITILANRDRIPVMCPEPNRKEEVKYLETIFPRRFVQYYYFSRLTRGWNRNSDKSIEYVKYMNNFLRKYSKLSDWDEEEFSIHNMKNIHKELFTQNFDKSDYDFFNGILNPSKFETKINEIARECSTFRDISVINKIKKLWENGKSLFVVYGGGHAIIEEPALKRILSNDS